MRALRNEIKMKTIEITKSMIDVSEDVLEQVVKEAKHIIIICHWCYVSAGPGTMKSNVKRIVNCRRGDLKMWVCKRYSGGKRMKDMLVTDSELCDLTKRTRLCKGVEKMVLKYEL